MEINIVDMVQDHVEEVLEVENRCFATPWPESSFLFEVNMNPMSRYYVAMVDGMVVGYGGVWAVVDEGHITNICVDPNYRGHGIGNLLVEQLIDISKEMGLNSMTLEVRRSNQVAKNLYGKYGFYSVGVRPNYYRKEKEDAIIMWKEF